VAIFFIPSNFFRDSRRSEKLTKRNVFGCDQSRSICAAQRKDRNELRWGKIA